MGHEQPNILFIMTDQHRADCLSAAGHPALTTPNLDEIAVGGARFTNAFTTCASCIAARRSLLTGTFPATHGVVGYRDGIPIHRPTLPARLAEAGYETALVGRTMHQYPKDESYGFATRVLGSTYEPEDEYASFLDWQIPGMGGIRSLGLSNNGWTVKPWSLPEYLHPTYWTARRAGEFLDDTEDESPLFLALSFYAPHPPLFPPPHYLSRYEAVELPAPWIGRWATPPSVSGLGFGVDSNHIRLPDHLMRRTRAAYYGLINQIDDALYPIVSTFKRKSRSARRPWLICMTSDHGEMLGDHYFFRKAEPYQGSAAIPLLLQGSDELEFVTGATPNGVVCLEDLMPTLLELADASCPSEIDGKSLVPMLRGEAAAVRDTLHSEHAECYDADQAYHMLTDGRIKYVWRPHSGREELFDLENDPTECHNLVDEGGADQLPAWRQRMVVTLRDRPEGFVESETLVAGRIYDSVIHEEL